jgi:uncharacterized membrane protein
MKQLVIVERLCLIGHSLAMAFGLAGLTIVLPHPDWIVALPSVGQTLFRWSMAGGGAVYIILGAITVALYAYRMLGLRHGLTFMMASVVLSLSSELLGTSTGFPFGHYRYLDGLGYKIASLVPFTIPLSWFYLGFVCYLMAASVLAARSLPPLIRTVGAIGLGAVFLTAWDLVLDPAMSQAPLPFWEFQDVGEFFGMPYRNLLGWLGTGAIFMTISALISRAPIPALTRSQLQVPLIIYLVNFAFGAVITLTQLDSRFWIPTSLGLLFGVVPMLGLWWSAKPQSDDTEPMVTDVESPELQTKLSTL